MLRTNLQLKINIVLKNLKNSQNSNGVVFFVFFTETPCNTYTSVCEHDISKSCGRIRTKLGGQVVCVTRKNLFDFGEDPDPDPVTRIF